MLQDLIQQVDINDLHESPFNPRKTFTDIADLAASIKAEGRVHQPLLVRPIIPPLFADQGDAAQAGFELVFGHRRLRAAIEAGLCVVPCMVRSMSDAEARSAQIAENLQRKDVHPIEEAEGFQAMIDGDGVSADDLVDLVGKSRSYIYGRLKLLQACPEIRAACLTGEIGSEVALLIARIPPKLQGKALSSIRQDTSSSSDMKDGGKRSYRHIRDHLAEKFTLNLRSAIFNIEDEMLVPAAGHCIRCPKRTGNAPEFADITAKERPSEHEGYYTKAGGPDICTDPDCFAAKKAGHLAREAAALQAKGEVVITGNKAKQAMDAHGNLKAGYMAVKDAKALIQQAAKAGTAAPAILSVQDQRTGKITKAVRTADLAAAGVKPPAPKGTGHGNQRDREAERRESDRLAAIEQAERRAVQAAIRPQMLAAHGSTDEMRMIVWLALKFVDWEIEQRVLALYGIHGKHGENWRQIDQLTADQLRQVLLDLVIDEAATVDYDLEADRDVLHAVARLYGLDPDAISAPSPAGASAESGDADAVSLAQGNPENAAPADADAQATVDAGVAGEACKAVPAWPFPKQAYA